MTQSIVDATSSPNKEAVFAELVDRMIDRLQSNDTVEIEKLVAEHPQHADQLRAVWSALEVMSELKTSGPLPTGVLPETQLGEPSRQTIGDFRILSLIGRGGMGMVYEAEQLSMSRHVALKILPFAALADSKAIQRFKNEVTAAAQLDHPNIVDVYSVACVKGVHHYAMRLIRGSAVSEIISALRLQETDRRWSSGFAPSSNQLSDQVAVSTQAEKPVTVRSKPSGYFQLVAEFGVSIARALDFAHEHGIVHRDVKPSNLLIDLEGKAWITDFGLAQVETGTAMTATGDILGTARYMSPEQIQAKRVVLDHRTDIYSLGVTLYESLTFETPFDSDNRHELFRQITFDSPRPMRQIQPAIPIDLETIVLKAMEKSPADRYQSAGEFASDLQRFMSNKPIAARRVGLVNRAQKWGRRHPTFMGASVSILGVIAVALVVISAVIANSLHQKKLQNKQLTELLAKNEKLSSETNRAIDNYVDMLIETDELANDNKLAGLRKKCFQSAIAYYQRFADELRTNPKTAADLAKAIGRLSKVRETAGVDTIRAAVPESINIIEELMQAGTADLELKKILASNYRGVADKALYRHDWENAIHWYDKSLGLYDTLNQEKLLDETEFLLKKKVILYALLQALNRSGEPRKAASVAHRQLEVLDQLIEKHPDALKLKKDAAETYIRLSEIALSENDSASVFASLERAESILTSLLEEDTGNSRSVLFELAKCHGTLGGMLIYAGENQLAIGRLESAAQIFDRLVAQNPKDSDSIRDRSINLVNMGNAYSNAGGHAGQIKSLEIFSEPINDWRKLLANDPEHLGKQEYLAATLYNRAISYSRLDQYDLAINDLIDCLSYREKLANVRTGKVRQNMQISMALNRLMLGRLYRNTYDLESAQIQVDLAQSIIAKLERDLSDSPDFLSAKGALDELKGKIAFREGDFMAAEQHLTAAANSVRKSLEKSIKKQYRKEQLARLQLWLGKVSAASNQSENSKGRVAEAAKIFRQLSDSGRADRYALQLGEVYYRQKQWENAIKSLKDMSSPLPQRMAQQQLMLALCFWNSGMKRESLQVLVTAIENIQQIDRPSYEIEEWLTQTATIVDAQEVLENFQIRNIRAGIKLAAGHIAFAREDYFEAEQQWKGALSLLSEASEQTSDHKQTAGSFALLATIHGRLGQLHAHLGRQDQSERELEDAADYQTRAVSMFSGIPKGRSKLIGYSVALARQNLDQGHYDRVDEVVESLTKLDPHNVFGVRPVSVTSNIQLLVTAAERLSIDEELQEQAKSFARHASGLLQAELGARHIDQQISQQQLDSAIKIAEIWQTLDQTDAANNTIQLAIHVIEANPSADKATALGRIISVLDSISRQCIATGRFQCSRRALRQKIALQKQLFASAMAAGRKSDNSEANLPTTEFLAGIRQDEARLVWLLSTSPNVPDASLKEAVEISKRLTDWDSENATMWLVRATASHRVGEFDDVIKSANMVGKLGSEDRNHELMETVIQMYRCLAEVRTGTETQVANALDQIRRVDVESLSAGSDEFILVNFQDVLFALQREAMTPLSR